MRFLTRRAATIAVAATLVTMVTGTAVAQANDQVVLNAVVAAGNAVATPAVTKATRKIDRNLHAHQIGAVVKPLGVYIQAYRRAVRLIEPTHGSTSTGKKLKVDALTSVKDYLNSAISLRGAAAAYLAGNIPRSNQLVRSYTDERSAAKKALTAALKQERLLLLR
jgi:hypothetical protein